MNKFSVWLLDKLNQQGWQQSEFARAAGISTGTLSNILNGNKKPGWDFCKSIAEALKVPYDEVFRQAGLLSDVNSPDDPEVSELAEVVSYLPRNERLHILDYARWRQHVYERKEIYKPGENNL